MSSANANTHRSPVRTARAEASVWMVRLQGEERTPELEAGLRAWLAAAPENARQFEHIADVWDLGGSVTAESLPRMRAWPSSPRRLHWALASIATLVCGVLLLTLVHGGWFGSRYATERGELRQIRLEDGSTVELNSDSQVRIDFTEQQRHVRLERGEALFEIAPDIHRPFIVRAGDRQITVLGTTFVVRYEPLRTAVTLMQGRVVVSPSSSRGGAGGLEPGTQSGHDNIILRPGERLTLARAVPPQLDFPRLEAVTAWRRGQVLLDAAALPGAVAEMNRYEKRPLVIDGPDLAGVRVSGIYRAGDSLGFAHAVAELHGLEVTELPDGIHLHRPGVHDQP